MPLLPGEIPESDQETCQTPPLFYQPAKPSDMQPKYLSSPSEAMNMNLGKMGDGEGQESLACCSPWGHKESDTTERLNNNNISSSKIRVVVVERLLHHKGKERGHHLLKIFFLCALFLVFIEFVKIWLLFYILVSFFFFFFFLFYFGQEACDILAP